MALFLSYNREDRQIVRTFSNALNAKKINHWFDDALVYGENWQSAIQRKIREADGFVIFVSKHFYENLNGFIHQELHMALDVVRRSGYEDWVYFVIIDDSDVPRLWINDDLFTTDFHSMRLSEHSAEALANKIAERFGGEGIELPLVRLINDSQLELTFALAQTARNPNFGRVCDGKTYWDNQMTGEGDYPPPEPEYFENTFQTFEVTAGQHIEARVPKSEYFVSATYVKIWMDPDGRSNGYHRVTSNAVSVDLKIAQEGILRCRRSQKKGGIFSSREASTYLFMPSPIIAGG
ncbi:MAG: toll/interleukin-1 receptor domain-containing protein [Pseudomonadota bacterium]